MRLNPMHLVPLVLSVPLVIANLALAQEEETPRFPDTAKAWLAEGTLPDPAAVDRVEKNLTRAQVRDLIGVPHFDEGFLRREWNYIFQTRTGAMSPLCQYQVHFDLQDRVSEVYWSSPACADVFKPK